MLINSIKIECSMTLHEAVHDVEWFDCYMDAYSSWSRRELDIPKNYRCWLGEKWKGEGIPEVPQWSLPITDDDGLFLDHCLHLAVQGDLCMTALANSVIISNNSCLDALLTNRHLKIQYRKAHRKFNLLNLIEDKKHIIDRTRYYACMYLDRLTGKNIENSFIGNI